MTEYEDFVMSGEGSSVSLAIMQNVGRVLGGPMEATNRESEDPLDPVYKAACGRSLGSIF